MRWLAKQLKAKPHIALIILAILCFITFIVNLIIALADWHLDNVELHQLLSSADAFESVALVLITLALQDRKK